jgi:hypothetical protein
MVTAEEIGEVAVFAPLALDARERLARAAADLMLIPGEDAAPQGSPSARSFRSRSGRLCLRA